MSDQVSRRRRAAPAALLLLAPLLVALALVPAASAPIAAAPALPAGARGLWPGESVTVRGTRSVVVGRAAQVASTAARASAEPVSLAELARLADTAALRVGTVLGEPVRPLVVVPASAAEAARLAGTGPIDGLAALADGDRVLVVPEVFARLNPTGRDVVLAHELTHVAAGTDRLPVWLYEGFADYVGYRDSGLPVRTAAAELADEVRAGRLPAELPGPAAFAADGSDPARLARAYQEAWLACRFLADRFGEGTLVRLYREARVDGADRALAGLGLSTATLTARWRAYVREQLA
ncbi:hypothetical protein SMD20_15070 [Nonomuraea sp. LP-02]|uniref:hypothetical protein n=1 Tax=Nonomuraea sp. LP-02 TaxID=3097960 RepID=UPI002E330038|nr:hypothetical protein [Nonomuraea sp. LP-02]MED7925573.1 hypothetical protein [Nonomuraea sp. LP-02]